jgi:hypothetical protein
MMIIKHHYDWNTLDKTQKKSSGSLKHRISCFEWLHGHHRSRDPAQTPRARGASGCTRITLILMALDTGSPISDTALKSEDDNTYRRSPLEPFYPKRARQGPGPLTRGTIKRGAVRLRP